MKKPRRNHSAAFKTRVALEAIRRGEDGGGDCQSHHEQLRLTASEKSTLRPHPSAVGHPPQRETRTMESSFRNPGQALKYGGLGLTRPPG